MHSCKKKGLKDIIMQKLEKRCSEGTQRGGTPVLQRRQEKRSEILSIQTDHFIRPELDISGWKSDMSIVEAAAARRTGQLDIRARQLRLRLGPRLLLCVCEEYSEPRSVPDVFMWGTNDQGCFEVFSGSGWSLSLFYNWHVSLISPETGFKAQNYSESTQYTLSFLFFFFFFFKKVAQFYHA